MQGGAPLKTYEKGAVLRYRLFRIQHHITRQELAKEAKISPQRISQIELMECQPTKQTKTKLLMAMRNVLLRHIQLADSALTDFHSMRDRLFDAVEESEVLTDE